MRQSVVARAIIAGLFLSGCGMAPKGPPPAHGVPIDPGPRPSADECGRMIRADLSAAKRIRADLRLDGVPSDDAAVRAAAADPGADLTGLTEDIRRRLIEKYGDIVVEEQGPVVPT